MKEFIIFVCTDSTEIFFSKLRSAGLNYNLFTDSYCAWGGGSNKHCLLTFFISIEVDTIKPQFAVGILFSRCPCVRACVRP